MPLTSIRLHDFRCFADSGKIPLAPLTVIFGRNNSGKSSILQSLLLLRQTLDSPERVADLSRVNLRGPLYLAGTYRDLVHGHRTASHVRIELGMSLPKPSVTAKVELEVRSDEPQSPLLNRIEVSGGRRTPLKIQRGQGYAGPYALLVGERNVGVARVAGFHFPVDSFLPEIGADPVNAGPSAVEHRRSRRLARAALSEFARILRQIRAVGAFRRQPDRRYEFQGRTPEAVDAAGEYVANALIEDATRRRGRGQLLRTVNRWLRRVGRVRLQPARRLFARTYELRLRDLESGQWANFSDMGFGIGQALPVLVEGLRTEPGGAFLVQEPEIHLHPDAQLVMADFLIDLARSGRQVVVETHSECLLLRIRRAVVDRRLRVAPRDVSVVIVEKVGRQPSRCRHLALDNLAQIEAWPAGFMEEATAERMAILEAAATRAEHGR